MGKFIDQLGSLETFKAPWESDTGTDAEIDPVKLKKYLYALMLDKATAMDARDEADAKVSEANKALEEAKAEVAAGDPSGKIADLERKLAKAQEDAQKAQGSLDRIEVGLAKGLSPEQARRLQGETREDLEKDADDLRKAFGIKDEPTDDDEVDDEDDDEDEDDLLAGGRTSPVTDLLVNPGAGDEGPKEYDYDRVAAELVSRRVI